MSTKSLSSIDTAWLRMEHPTNLMMITAVMGLGAPADFERLKATFEHRLLGHYPRFRQRVVETASLIGAPHWEDADDFDINAHVLRTTLPPPGDQAALQNLVSDLMSTQLDFSRPLWQVHVVENYGQGCAVIARLHHCIADGIALMRVLLSLTDPEPDAPWPAPKPQKARGPRGAAGSLLKPVNSALKLTSRVTKIVMDESLETLVHPSHAVKLARQGADGVVALGRLALRLPDPKTIFKGKLDVSKRAAWSAPISLQDVKAVGRTLGGTVNDVLLTAMTGALRRYLEEHDQSIDDLNFRAIVPVNLRAWDVEPDPDLGNKFSLIFLSLPVGVTDPLERLRELRRRMDELKHSSEAAMAFGILNAIGLAPSEVHNIVVNIFGAKATAVMTNVPGPKQKLYMAGVPLDTLMFWVPQSGRLGMGVSIMSYAGQVWMGIATDAGLVPDPEAIIRAFHAEFDELIELARKKRSRPSKVARPLAAMLDDALAALDGLLEEKQAAE